MSQKPYLGKLIKTLEQELLKSSLKVQSAELELKLVVHQENDEVRIHILDSETEADWKNLHTLKVKILKDTGTGPGGSGGGSGGSGGGSGKPPGG
jgi:hypothetical protein